MSEVSAASQLQAIVKSNEKTDGVLDYLAEINQPVLVIDGSNVRIPAHYHGCIVGVTLAFMGVVLRLLPALGYAAPVGRLATAQPWIYGLGQLLHIAGLVWSGGYGVQRKVAGAEQVLRSPGEIAGMALMGLGGAIAIVGGLLFVVVVLRAMRARRAVC